MHQSLTASAAAAARALFDSSPMTQIRRLHVEPVEQGLVISGRVDSFYLKQLAQETLREVSRDLQLNNQVVVEASTRVSHDAAE